MWTCATFTKQLAIATIEQQIRKRDAYAFFPRELKLCIRRILEIQEESEVAQEEPLGKRKICSGCPSQKRRMTKFFAMFARNLFGFNVQKSMVTMYTRYIKSI